jgi:hypothetical protein
VLNASAVDARALPALLRAVTPEEVAWRRAAGAEVARRVSYTEAEGGAADLAWGEMVWALRRVCVSKHD